MRNKTNSNEKSERNHNMFLESQDGAQLIEIADKYKLSVPRVHRIIMQEENKHLKQENRDLRYKLEQKS